MYKTSICSGPCQQIQTRPLLQRILIILPYFVYFTALGRDSALGNVSAVPSWHELQHTGRHELAGKAAQLYHYEAAVHSFTSSFLYYTVSSIQAREV